jgi:hypothetical protein
MKRRVLVVIFFIPMLLVLAVRQPLYSQTCNDNEAMVKSYETTLADLVSAVKKESLSDFQKDYHQQSCLTDLNLSLTVVDPLLECLDKEAKDSAATKEQVDAAKSKEQAYAKLKSMLGHDRDALKAAKDPKAAKAIIEKITITP